MRPLLCGHPGNSPHPPPGPWALRPFDSGASDRPDNRLREDTLGDGRRDRHLDIPSVKEIGHEGHLDSAVRKKAHDPHA